MCPGRGVVQRVVRDAATRSDVAETIKSPPRFVTYVVKRPARIGLTEGSLLFSLSQLKWQRSLHMYVCLPCFLFLHPYAHAVRRSFCSIVRDVSWSRNTW